MKHSSQIPLFAALLLVLINLIWAGSSLCNKTALETVHPFTLITLRFGPSCLLLFALCWSQKLLRRVDSQDWWRFIGLGVLGGPVTYGIFYSGMTGSSASEANLVIAAEPILIAVLAYFLLKERLTKVQLWGLTIGFTGLYILIMRGITPRFEGESLSNGIMTAALVFECMASIIGKALTDKYPGLFVVAVEFAICIAISLPLALWELAKYPVHSVSPAFTGSVLYLCLGCSFFAYGVWYWMLPRYDVSTMSGFLFIQPMAGPFFAYLIRHEKLSPATWTGAGLILVGVWLVAVMGGRSQVFHEPAPEPAAFP